MRKPVTSLVRCCPKRQFREFDDRHFFFHMCERKETCSSTLPDRSYESPFHLINFGSNLVFSLGEQLKPEATLDKSLAANLSFFAGRKSPWFGHVAHFELAIEHRNPDLNKQVCALVGPPHLPFFAQRRLTTSLTADSAATAEMRPMRNLVT
ncbi:MAG: hypothetical protein H7327_13970 [Herminiimonas sp.]|nr:hypothetical protein [Herminiimonas sp.]